MSLKSNSLKNKTNSFVEMSDQMLTLMTDIDKAIAEDMSLLKPTIDLSQLSSVQFPDFKKFPKSNAISKVDIESEIEEIDKQFESFAQMKTKDEMIDHQKGLDIIGQSIDHLTKCLPRFKRMANGFTEKSKNNSIFEKQNLERKSKDIDDQRAEQLLRSAQQLLRLQKSNRFVKSVSNND